MCWYVNISPQRYAGMLNNTGISEKALLKDLMVVFSWQGL